MFAWKFVCRMQVFKRTLFYCVGSCRRKYLLVFISDVFSFRRHIFHLQKIQVQSKLYHIFWRVYYIKKKTCQNCKFSYKTNSYFICFLTMSGDNWLWIDRKRFIFSNIFPKIWTLNLLFSYVKNISSIHFDGTSIISAKVNYWVVFHKCLTFQHSPFSLITSVQKGQK